MLLFFGRAVITVRNGCDAKGRNLKGLDRSESKLAVNKEVKRHGNSRATTREGSYVKQVRPAEHRWIINEAYIKEEDARLASRLIWNGICRKGNDAATAENNNMPSCCLYVAAIIFQLKMYIGVHGSLVSVGAGERTLRGGRQTALVFTVKYSVQCTVFSIYVVYMQHTASVTDN